MTLIATFLNYVFNNYRFRKNRETFQPASRVLINGHDVNRDMFHVSCWLLWLRTCVKLGLIHYEIKSERSKQWPPQCLHKYHTPQPMVAGEDPVCVTIQSVIIPSAGWYAEQRTLLHCQLTAIVKCAVTKVRYAAGPFARDDAKLTASDQLKSLLLQSGKLMSCRYTVGFVRRESAIGADVKNKDIYIHT